MMTDIEKRILENQMEILWALRHLAEKASPELVGRAGALDRMRDDLADAAKRTQALFVSSPPPQRTTCPTCFRTDQEYKDGREWKHGGMCGNPWHADDHLRATTSMRQGQ